MPRLDRNPELKEALFKYCRLERGQIWEDPAGRHRVGCLDAGSKDDIETLMAGEKATLAVHDPPYNLTAFDVFNVTEFIAWCETWIDNTYDSLADNASLYVWLGADQVNGFQPLPDFMIMMRDKPFKTKSFLTVRNQRGYGTQKNWMAVRQELLFYTKGKPSFNVEAEYTDIPKILRGYYKDVGGKNTENMERSKSENIRAGNVWVDIQQIFHLMEENVYGCYAQKPLKSCDRIIRASSCEGDLLIDFFCHSGSTLLSAEMLGRKCYTIDYDPVYCEIAIRRLERFRTAGLKGWQMSNPFEKEIEEDISLRSLLDSLSKEKKAQETETGAGESVDEIDKTELSFD